MVCASRPSPPLAPRRDQLSAELAQPPVDRGDRWNRQISRTATLRDLPMQPVCSGTRLESLRRLALDRRWKATASRAPTASLAGDRLGGRLDRKAAPEPVKRRDMQAKPGRGGCK